MLKRYANVLMVCSLLMIVLTTSGCYTVLKMRSNAVYHPEYYHGDYDVYSTWYEPFYYYHPYHYYSSYYWHYNPWTYWCCDPYWTYPYYYGTRSYCYDPYDHGPLKWQKGPRRRGFHTRKATPRYAVERRAYPSKSSYRGETKGLKRLRKVGTGSESKPARRTGITHTSRTTSRSTPAVSRQTSRSSRSTSSKATTRSRSSSPSRRRR